MKKLKRRLKFLYYYFRAHIILLFHYDKNVTRSKWFHDELYKGIASVGWKWVVVDYVQCKKNGVNLDCPWPVNPHCRIAPNYENLHFDLDDLNDFQGYGCVFQTYGHIYIGKGTFIANNVGIITANHNFHDLNQHYEPKDVRIGENCWIGMNSVILPGVCLGNNTIVGAGAIVTKSFEEGNCVIAGNPAKIIKLL